MVGLQHKAQDVAARPRTEDIQITEDIDFKSFLLPAPILKGLKQSGYVKPSPIQRKALPLVRCGLDLIVQAKAGTGKTCVFTIAALEMVQADLPHLQAIILAPTREIALQITDVIRAIGQGITGLKTGCFIGGYPVSQDEAQAKGCHIAVGAPGRLRHLVSKGVLNTSRVRLFVLDEADKLLEKAFVGDINVIFSHLPESKQVLACSATYTPELLGFLQCYMHRGQYVSPLQAANTTVLIGIRQYVSVLDYHVDSLVQLRLKERHLLYLLQSIPFNQCLVFSNLHTRAVSVCNMLRSGGWSADWIAGRQEQADRVIALTQLKEQRVRVLVTTDLTARGIDVENVNLVINLDVPQDHHTYLHRMGRAGRYGSHGMVITVVSSEKELVAFQKLVGAIGGTSQTVNRVPEDLKTVDLWTATDEDLEQVYGVVQSTENAPDVDDECAKITDTAKGFAREKRNVLKDTAIEEIVVNNTCSCKLFTAEESDIETICGPSLFSVSNKEEQWNEVLPVVVKDFRVPLNMPVALFGSKLVRVKFWDKILDEPPNTEMNGSNDKVVDLVTECDISFCDKRDFNEVVFLSFDEIISTLETEIEVKIDLEHNMFGSAKMLSFEEIENVLEKPTSDTEVETCDERKSDGIHRGVGIVLQNYQNTRNALESLLRGFDSFDVVGWMAVDKYTNILEYLKINKCDIFEFDLIKCPHGNNHVKATPSTSFSDTTTVEQDCEDTVSTLKLEEFNLTSPFSLGNLAQKLASDNSALLSDIGDDSLEALINKSFIDEKQKLNALQQLARLQKSSKELDELNRLRHRDKINLLKPIESRNPVNPCNKPKGNVSNKKPSSNNNCAKDSSKSNSINGHKLAKRVNPLGNYVSLSNGTKPQKKFSFNKPIVNSSHKPSNKGDSKRYNVFKEEVAQRREYKPASDTDTSSSVSSESSYESDTCSSKYYRMDYNPCALPNGYQETSSASSKESGPYVDMAQNLTKWQELHDFEESDSESSSKSDVVCSAGIRRVRDTYSDTTNSSETAFKQKLVHHRLAKQGKSRASRHDSESDDSYDSVLSETSNCHSFQTARSDHICSPDNKIVLFGTPYCRQCLVADASAFYESGEKCPCQNRALSTDTHRIQEEQTSERNRPSRTRPSKSCIAQSDSDDDDSYPVNLKRNTGTDTSLGASSKPPRVLKANNLFFKWYTTWYTEVRQRALLIQKDEYINYLVRRDVKEFKLRWTGKNN